MEKLFGDRRAMYIEDVLLKVIRSTEVLSAERARESIPGPESSTLVPGVSRQRGSWPICTSTHDTPKFQLAGRDTLHHGARCKHTHGGFLHYGLCSNPPFLIHKTGPRKIQPFSLSFFLSHSPPSPPVSHSPLLLPSLIPPPAWVGVQKKKKKISKWQYTDVSRSSSRGNEWEKVSSS